MINLLVLFGGVSTEHEISIISAIQAMENMDKKKYNIVPVYIAKNGDFYYAKNLYFDTKNFKNIDKIINESIKVTLVKDGNKVYLKNAKDKFFGKINILIDIAFPIVHGTNVEDGNLQGYIHTLGLPLVGSDCLASAIGMNKYVMKKYLKEEGVSIIDGIELNIEEYKNRDQIINNIESSIKYPMITKPVDLGSSIGISKAKNREELIESLDLAFSFSNIVVVEKAIVNMREINCSVLGDRYEALASVLEEPFGNDEILSYKDKYMSGNKSGSKIGKTGTKISGTKGGMASLDRKIPAEIDEDEGNKIRNMAVEVFKKIGCCGVARIDFIIDKDDNKIYVNEINTIPGSLSFYLWEASGIKYIDLIDRLVDISLKEKRRNDKLKFTFDENVLR